jgi:molybdopterin/thiamine biosynthesis adenylyltransferase/rhodanese-related sulfurtransferase
MRTVALDELKRRLDAGERVIVVDVRELDEVRSGVMPGALTIARGRLPSEMPSRVPDRATRIVTVCAAGPRAALAAQALEALGYSDVEAAKPGMTAWKARGWPVVTPTRTRTSTMTDAHRERYARHLRLPEIGEAGQERLLRARVLIVGAGGLGSAAALYLAAAGVGTLGIVDADVVELSNLQRQVVHATSRLGAPKVESAAGVLADLNPDVRVVAHAERLDAESVDRLFAGYDIVIDGSDNFPTRYLVNDASVLRGVPVVHASVLRFDGQVTTFLPPDAATKLGLPRGPCYRCLFPAPPPPHLAPSCEAAGVLGVLPGMLGVLQATEALKLILGIGKPLVGRLVVYDGLAMTFHEIALHPAPSCPACGDAPTIRSYVDYEAFCAGA